MSTRKQQRAEVVGRWLAGIVTTGEAALLLGCSERTAWRLRGLARTRISLRAAAGPGSAR